jgi:hypothetical protein
MNMHFISCWMLMSNYRFSKNSFPVMLPCMPVNLEPSFATARVFLLYSNRLISLSLITSKPGRPFLCNELTLMKNLYTPMSIVWAFSSSCNIDPLLVKTFLTSRIVSILSSISNACSSSLVLELKNLMVSVASVGLSSNSILILSMDFMALYTSSCCSNTI